MSDENMKLLWVDLETTGLDETKGQILEVAACLGDFRDPFNPEPVLDMVTRDSDMSLEDIRGLADPKVQEMHDKSGLWNALGLPTVGTVALAEEVLLRYVPFSEDVDGRVIIAGSSVHFDHRWIERHMPRLFARLSYRRYDSRNIQLFCRSLGMPKIEKKEGHRAMPDIKEAIQAARDCATWLFTHNAGAAAYALRRTRSDTRYEK